MFEKVSKYHPDKIADRIAGAIVDVAYTKEKNPKIAVEVLLGHGHATVIVESSVKISAEDVTAIVERIAGITKVKYIFTRQDVHLADNQAGHFRCGDNGIFKGVPVTTEQRKLARFVKWIAREVPYDGKYLVNDSKLICCQSHVENATFKERWGNEGAAWFEKELVINPLGEWTGGPDVDAGATNRKLGSDMGDSVTGGGLHGKDLSKADVSVNVYAWLKAQELGKTVELSCAIGDEFIDGKPYGEIVLIARNYIQNTLGGFEKFAEWGLI